MGFKMNIRSPYIGDGVHSLKHHRNLMGECALRMCSEMYMISTVVVMVVGLSLTVFAGRLSPWKCPSDPIGSSTKSVHVAYRWNGDDLCSLHLWFVSGHFDLTYFVWVSGGNNGVGDGGWKQRAVKAAFREQAGAIEAATITAMATERNRNSPSRIAKADRRALFIRSLDGGGSGKRFDKVSCGKMSFPMIGIRSAVVEHGRGDDGPVEAKSDVGNS